MRQGQSPVFKRIGKALHDQFNEVVHEPLPDRWIDLINYLNEKERAEREAAQRGTEQSPKRRTH